MNNPLDSSRVLTPEVLQALTGLRDLHLPLPEQRSDAQWFVFGLLFLLLVGLGIIAWLRWRRRPRQLVLQKLRQCATSYRRSGQTERFLLDISCLLRQVAIARYGPLLAGLSGERWLHWLDEQMPPQGASVSRAFQEGVGRVLLDGPYQRPGQMGSASADDLLDLVRRWLRANA